MNRKEIVFVELMKLGGETVICRSTRAMQSEFVDRQIYIDAWSVLDCISSVRPLTTGFSTLFIIS